MVNTQLLESRIDKSGLKNNYICDTLGISTQAFWKKKTNQTPFRMSEVYVLCDLLKISADDDKREIFFS